MRKQEYGEKIYHAAFYLRLSDQDLKEDADESDSIANQEALLREYIKNRDDIQLRYVFKDDGWSGVNFDRPGFQKMMEKIYDGEINCVIVKDLSRLGRNHVETGRYIARVFPAWQTRLISVDDNLDSSRKNSFDDYLIPFRNLVNDSYSRDISMKIRSAKKTRKQDGVFGGGRIPYGYDLDSVSKEHYAIDEEAASVVRMIFRWTFSGIGSTEIVRRLNKMRILPPSEYRKKRKARNYVPSDAKWNIRQIYRILRSDVYEGTLRLGKYTRPNYKVRKVLPIPEDQQFIFRNAHEAIIPPEEFELMQELLDRESKVHIKNGNSAFDLPLEGYVYCADCGSVMKIRTVRSGEGLYQNYICGKNIKSRQDCRPHTIRADKLEQVVLKAINTHLKILFDADQLLDEEKLQAFTLSQKEEIEIRIGRILQEKQKLAEYAREMYWDYKEGVLTLEEYQELQEEARKQMDALAKNAAELEMEKNSGKMEDPAGLYWVRKYKEKGELEKITRRDVVTFLDRIEIKDEKHIKIRFRFGDEYKAFLKKQEEAMGVVS